MKRTAQWFVVGAVLVVLLAACGDSNPSISVQQAATTTSTTSAVAPSSTTSTTLLGTPALQTITYQGVQFQVPGSWPVYTLATDTKRCVRLDQHAVFLGTQGADPDCPARGVGRTETVQVQPLGGGTKLSEALATSDSAINGLAVRLDPNATTAGALTAVLPTQGVLVTISFGTDRVTADQILQSLHAA